MPLVSVVIPAYNCAGTIRQAVASVLAQTYGELEVVIVDDCSTDDTFAVCQELAQGDGRIRVQRNEKNTGPAGARNKGIALAAGEYIAFLDGDDRWLPTKLQKQFARLQSTGASLCYTSYTFIDSAGADLEKPYIVPEDTDYKAMLAENVIGLSTVLVKEDALKDFRFNGRYVHEDYALWLELLQAGCTMVGLREVLVQYRRGGRSANKVVAAKGRWVIYREVAKLPFLQAVRYFLRYAFAGIRKRV